MFRVLLASALLAVSVSAQEAKGACPDRVIERVKGSVSTHEHVVCGSGVTIGPRGVQLAAQGACPLFAIIHPEYNTWKSQPGSGRETYPSTQRYKLLLRFRCATNYLLGFIPSGSTCVGQGQQNLAPVTHYEDRSCVVGALS